ncbi:MAG: phosphatidylglycerophosphatase A [Planctomycetales bacterium]|nr:phosphatidylglycerophosphatase A [Planctomycetales bacterium]
MKKEAWLTTVLGLGKLPVAPGTFGSLVPVVLYQALGYLSFSVAVYVMAFLVLAGSWVCIQYAPAMITATGKKDPQQVVADEVAGQALAILAIALLSPANICNSAVFGFVLFRLFDILKPWPCKRLEKLPAGLGILADDLAAGLWVALVWAGGRCLGQFDTSPGTVGPEGLSVLFTLFLGIVQGLMEFLPVSSEGHLVLFEHFIPGIDAEAPQMLLFDLCLHLGTVASIFVVFRKDIVRFFRSLVSALRSRQNPMDLYRQKAPVRLLVLAFIASAVTALIYALFKDFLESGRGLFALGFWWVVSAGFLYWADFRKGRIGLKRFKPASAGLIGLAQALAILPSVSRSGSTISTAILLGIKPRWAVEFSFLISIPAILGGTLLKMATNFDSLRNGQLPVIPILAGMATAFIAGVIALKLLIRIARKRQFKGFAFYCLLLAIITFISLLP